MKKLWLVAVLLLSSCVTGGPRHVAVLADTALYEVLNDIHTTEQIVLCGVPSCAGITGRLTASWTDEKSQDFNRRLLPVVTAGREFNNILAAWVPGQPMPVQLRLLIQGLSSSLSAVTASFPDGTTKTTILADIAKAQAIVLGAIDLTFAINGVN